ncbi:kinesin-domain-containing protein [Melanogaster broomeanus]|nr:kinesin-domain-containing protein [Melanogaster broomeanus]
MATRAKASAPATRASARTKTPPVPPPSPPPAIKATATRKPLASRANSPDKAAAGKPRVTKAAHAEQEPIMAYLRIRPHLSDDEPMSMPYLDPLSDTAVRMTDPSSDGRGASVLHYRGSTTPPSSIYKFSHVFLPSTQQADFFAKTTLPLVRDLLDGQNGLLFAYGATNSGKTFTIQGGILPRTLDVIFNSYRPIRLYGTPPLLPIDTDVPSEPGLAEVFAEHMAISDDSVDVDPTVIKLDRNYEYSIWISYVEVYNEKVYDLLASVNDDQDNEGTGIPRSTSNLPGQSVYPVLVTRKALNMQGNTFPELNSFALRVPHKQRPSQSSRSHSMITIKVLKNHRGDRDRTKHTQTTGDRLKEAGNINKSLMVLGQCMEIMRSNQKRLAQSLANPGRTDTRDMKKALAVVPFRHSKLTEILMDYFAGDGRVVMIVNVNPYDTGFDENSHVMKFSALAREVSTVINNAPIARVQASPTKRSAVTKPVPVGSPYGVTRKVTISSFGPGKKLSEAHLEVLEEDEETMTNLFNPLVDALFDEIEDLRLRLYEAEMRCAIVEAETREEVMREMEERMRAVERSYAQRLMSEVERNERKMDAKIDMLHQAGLLGTAKKPAVVSASESDPEDPMEDISQVGKGNSAARTGPMSHHAALSDTDSSNPSAGRCEGEEEDISDLSSSGDESDDYVPPTPAAVKKGKTKPAKTSTGRRGTKSAGLSILGDAVPEADDSVVILPNRRVRQATVELKGPGVEYVPGKGEVDTVKKKKRKLGKKIVVTEEQVEEVVGAMEERTLRGGSKKNIRRMGRIS